MKALKEETGIIKTSRLVALLSFVFGSLILLFFYLTENTLFMLLGIIYLFAAVVVNSVFLSKLILQYSKSEDKKGVKSSVILMLLNIPIAFSYYLFVRQIFSSIIEIL
jgi:hypothetical protein